MLVSGQFRLSVFVAGCLWLLAAPLPADDAEGVKLVYKFNKGEKTLFRTGGELKQVQTINNQKIETTMNTTSFGSRLVDTVDETGAARIKVKTERMTIKSSIAGQTDYEFDSKSTERDKSSAIGAALTPLYERLSGVELELSIAANGEIKDLKGYAEALGDLLKDNPIGAGFTGGGSNDAAKTNAQELFPVMSDKPVKPGDTWGRPVDIDLKGIGKIKGKVTYKYVGPDKLGERATAKITAITDLSIEINLDVTGAKATGTLTSSNSEATVQFDPAAGRVVSYKSTQTIGGQLSIDVNNMTIPLQSDQTQATTYELLDKLPE